MTSMTWSGPDDAGGVLVDAQAEQARVLGDEASRRPSRFRCWKCWSTMTPGQQPEAGGDLGHALLRRRARRPNAIMWLLIAEAPADVPATTAPVPEAVEDRVGEARAADRRRQPQLVAAGQEDAGRVAHRERGGLVVGLRPGDGVERPDASSRRAPLKTSRYRSPASGPSDEAVLMTAIVASGPPASATNRLRITRSRTLSSAPPMMMTVPSVT